MKANELMQGDIVLYEYNGEKTHAMVVEIYRSSALVESVSKEYEPIEIIEDKLFPVALTPEILEKNGFEKRFNYQWEYRDNSCKIVISIAPQIEIEGEILGESPINLMLEGALFNIDITSDCCYVHTLQHALRLCGIEKEIEL